MKAITQKDLEENLKHIEKEDKEIVVDGVKVKLDDKKYAYFYPDGNDIHIYTSDFIIPIMGRNYGFPADRIVKTKNINPAELDISFSKSSSKEYTGLTLRPEANLNESLEIIAKCVNDSIAYDIKLVEQNYREGKIGWEWYKELVKCLKKSNYKPNGEETMKGICADAGNLIRKLLAETIVDEDLRCAEISAQSKISHHDTTFVLDIKTGNWVVVNSKSPLKQYNLVPKEKLDELGYPYSNK